MTPVAPVLAPALALGNTVVLKPSQYRDLAPGEMDERTGKAVQAKHADWTTHPNNPMRSTA